MKKMNSLFAALILSVMGIPSVLAGEGLTVTDAWTRPVILENRPGAAYFIIHNMADKADKLIAASSTKAKRVELHVHKHMDGVMKMMEVENIPVGAHEMTHVKPGGYHLMLFGLNEKLAVGGELPLTLTFENAGEVKIIAKVMKKAPMMSMDHSKMDHSKMDHSKMKHNKDEHKNHH